MRARLLGLLLLATGAAAVAQAESPAVRLWPAPVAAADAPPEQRDLLRGEPVAWDVSEPELLPVLPVTRGATTAPAVIILPGGGGRILGLGSAHAAARALAAQGIPAFVLKHRTLLLGLSPDELKQQLQENPMSPPVRRGQPRPTFDDIQREVSQPAPWRAPQIADTHQAVRLLRTEAARWGLDPRRVILVGQSNGGVVVAEALEAADEAVRPSAAAFLYGAPPRKVRVSKLPIYVAVAADDALTRAGSLQLATDWLAAGESAELHVYAKGGHGFRAPGSSAQRSWQADLVNWVLALPPPP